METKPIDLKLVEKLIDDFVKKGSIHLAAELITLAEWENKYPEVMVKVAMEEAIFYGAQAHDTK